MHSGTHAGNRVTGYWVVGWLNRATRITVCFQAPVVTLKMARFAVSMDFMPMVKAWQGRASKQAPNSRWA